MRERVEQLLHRLEQPCAAAYKPVFIELSPERLRAQADAADARRQHGLTLGPLDGCLIAVKDLFDVAGEVTGAGSTILRNAPPAQQDSTAVARLRRAGAVLVGRTNMSEFAFSGLGLNPHYGTPPNPLDPTRVPGGSTSGGAVAVALGWVDAALGTDTSGSVRIPAAFCGLSGWKPTWNRIPCTGVFPLAASLDSVGAIAGDITLCSHMDAALSGDARAPATPPSLNGLTLGVADDASLEGARPEIGEAFKVALERIAAAGARLVPLRLRSMETLRGVIEQGGFVTAEAYLLHSQRLQTHAAQFDPLVRQRMSQGAAWSDTAWRQALEARRAAVVQTDAQMKDVDALLLPTTPEGAPELSAVSDGPGFRHHNAASIRHTMWANILQLCSSVLPLQAQPGQLPASLMLFGRAGSDRRLLALTQAVERALKGRAYELQN